MHVVVHLVGGLTGLLEREHLAHHRMDHPLADEPVGLPRLLVVGEVAADEPLQPHPEVAVVELEHEATGGRARDHRATALGHVH